MSTSKINVWVLRRDKRCQVEDRFEHFVYVVDCDGNPLVWCGKKYVALKTKCGHLEIDVPPGCYFVGAVTNPFSSASFPPFGNHLTHLAMVRVNCGDHACVTLFDPTAHFCGTWFWRAIDNLAAGGVRGELATALETARPALAKLVTALEKADPDNFATNLETTLGGRTAVKGKKRG